MKVSTMRFAPFFICFSLIFAASGTVSPVKADELLEIYHARLGTDDHFNSRGQRLTNAAAIIRQDRANFHKFGVRDRGDTSDEFFSSKSNRAILERMLRNGSASRSTLRRIVNGTPRITVKIYRHYINVFVR